MAASEAPTGSTESSLFALLNVTIETMYKDEKRRFECAAYDSLEAAFPALRAFVVDSYSLELSNNERLLIQYKDEESDLVTLGNIEDFTEALEQYIEENENKLILYITIQSVKPRQEQQTNKCESEEKNDGNSLNDKNNKEDFGSDFLKDLCNNKELKNEFISFLKTLLVLIQKTSFDPSFDIETCVMQALSSHEVLMDYPPFDKYLKKFLEMPQLSNKIKLFSTFLCAVDPSQIEVWVNKAVEYYRIAQEKECQTKNNNKGSGQNSQSSDDFGDFAPFIQGLSGLFGNNANGSNNMSNNGGFGGNNGGMPFFMPMLANMFGGQMGNGNLNTTQNSTSQSGATTESGNEKTEKPTKGVSKDENENNKSNQNGSNDRMNGNNDSWQMPPPPPPFEFDFASLINSFGANVNGNENGNQNDQGASSQGQGSNINNSNNDNFRNFPNFNHPHPWRGHFRGGRGRGRGRGGGFGHFAQLLSTLAAANGANGSNGTNNNNPFGAAFGVPQEAQASQNNDNDKSNSFDAIILSDDKTLGNGVYVRGSEILFKTWRIKNTSGITWSHGKTMIKYIGEPFNPMVNGASFVLNESKDVLTNDEIECQIMIVAPNDSGNYKSEWSIVLENGKTIKCDKKLIVDINVIKDDEIGFINKSNDKNNDVNVVSGNKSKIIKKEINNLQPSTNVAEMTGETDMNESIISLISNDNNNNNNNNNNDNNNDNDMVIDESINELANSMILTDMTRTESKEIIDNNNDNEAEMKDEIMSLAASMVKDDNDNDNNNDKNNETGKVSNNKKPNEGDKQNESGNNGSLLTPMSFSYAKELKSLKEMGFGAHNEELLKSLLMANNGNLDKVVNLLDFK